MNIRTNKAGRNVLVNLFTDKIVCEVGTERGKFAEKIAQVASKLYVVDLWKNYPGYRQHVSDAEYEDIFLDAHKRLDKYDVGFVRADSVSAAELFDDESLDAVYLDANHTYESVKKDLECWYRVVKVGGIVSGHDYNEGWGKKDGLKYGVIQAVNEFCKENNLPELTVWTGDSSHSFHFLKV